MVKIIGTKNEIEEIKAILIDKGIITENEIKAKKENLKNGNKK